MAGYQFDVVLKGIPHVGDRVLGFPSELPGSATLCINPAKVSKSRD
jgi:hypothetical protein